MVDFEPIVANGTRGSDGNFTSGGLPLFALRTSGASWTGVAFLFVVLDAAIMILKGLIETDIAEKFKLTLQLK